MRWNKAMPNKDMPKGKKRDWKARITAADVQLYLQYTKQTE